MVEWMCGWITEWMCGWITEWMCGWISEWMCGWMSHNVNRNSLVQSRIALTLVSRVTDFRKICPRIETDWSQFSLFIHTHTNSQHHHHHHHHHPRISWRHKSQTKLQGRCNKAQCDTNIRPHWQHVSHPLHNNKHSKSSSCLVPLVQSWECQKQTKCFERRSLALHIKLCANYNSNSKPHQTAFFLLMIPLPLCPQSLFVHCYLKHNFLKKTYINIKDT